MVSLCRLQVFHIIKKAERGGENVIVDGFNVAKVLKEKYPDSYEFLSTYPIEAEYLHKVIEISKMVKKNL